MPSDPAQGALFTHRNHYLFSGYYLDRRAPERQEWREADAAPALAAVTALWRRFKPQGDNEAQIQDIFLSLEARLVSTDRLVVRVVHPAARADRRRDRREGRTGEPKPARAE